MKRKQQSGTRTGAAPTPWRRPPWIPTVVLVALAGTVGCRSDLPWKQVNGLTATRAAAVNLLARLGTPVEALEATAANSPEMEDSPIRAAAHISVDVGGNKAAAPKPANVPLVPAVAAIPSPCGEAVIDLETALRRGGASNPTIAIAREAVQLSLADQLQADVLMAPALDAGVSYNNHQGNLESSSGIIRNVDRQSLYAGAGALAVGAGTVGYPGIRLTFQVADAVFEPMATRQAVAARGFDAAATQNNILLDVAVAYFELAGAAARLGALRQSASELAVVADITAKFAAAGQGRESDANRARSETDLLESLRHRVEEEGAVAAAELARLLDLDPSVALRAPEGPLPLLQLVDPRSELEPLVQVALANHPELKARNADVAVTETRLRKELVRPWVPLVFVGYSVGGFGGGSNLVDTSFGHFNSRTDLDMMAVWSLKNLGLGNLAIQRQNRALVGEALAERAGAADAIRRAVAEALTLCGTRLQNLDIARRRVANAQEGYRLDLTRTRNLDGRPIEVLNSLHLLTTARQDLIRAQVGYNQAQFQLLVAIGQPPG